MSVGTNPDRVYVNRQYRAKIRVDRDEEPTSPSASLPGAGATLLDISEGGCCLKLIRSDVPFTLDPGCQLSAIKLLHPALDGTPIRGRVAWAREEPPCVLIGIQFTHVRPVTRDSILSYLETSRNA